MDQRLVFLLIGLTLMLLGAGLLLLAGLNLVLALGESLRADEHHDPH